MPVGPWPVALLHGLRTPGRSRPPRELPAPEAPPQPPPPPGLRSHSASLTCVPAPPASTTAPHSGGSQTSPGPADSTPEGRGQAQSSKCSGGQISTQVTPVCPPFPDQPEATRAAGAAATQQNPNLFPALPLLTMPCLLGAHLPSNLQIGPPSRPREMPFQPASLTCHVSSEPAWPPGVSKATCPNPNA